MAQLAPGPLAAQLGIYSGFVHYGFIGATLAGLAFILPLFLMVNTRLYLACRKSLAYSKILEIILSNYIEKGFKTIQIFKGVSFEPYLSKVKSDRQMHLSQKAYESYLEFNLFRKTQMYSLY
jgi:uncharacterized protein YhbP (UPF0306 family)